MNLLKGHTLLPPAGKQAIAMEAGADRLGALQRQRLAIWIGAGLAGGLALATLSSRQWSRVGALTFGAGAWVLRSPIGPALLAAVLARATANDGREVNVEAGRPPTSL